MEGLKLCGQIRSLGSCATLVDSKRNSMLEFQMFVSMQNVLYGVCLYQIFYVLQLELKSELDFLQNMYPGWNVTNLLSVT